MEKNKGTKIVLTVAIIIILLAIIILVGTFRKYSIIESYKERDNEIKSADNIIDLGPEGGDGGGSIVATGTPEEISKVKESYTGQFLKKML